MKTLTVWETFFFSVKAKLFLRNNYRIHCKDKKKYLIIHVENIIEVVSKSNRAESY